MVHFGISNPSVVCLAQTLALNVNLVLFKEIIFDLRN